MLLSPIDVEAVVFSSILALLCCGLTLTYMTTKVPNFAQGTLATIGVYFVFTVVKIWNLDPYLYGWPSFVLGGLAGLGTYYLVMKPLLRRGASLVGLMIATVGVDLILFAIVNIYADYLTDAFRVPTRLFNIQNADFRFDAGFLGTNLPGILMIGPLTVMIIVIMIHFFLTRTRFGIAMRATVENPSLAGVVGVNVDLVYAASWFVSGGLAGLAGDLAGLYLIGNPDLGMVLIPTIFAGSIVGGLTNIYGSLIGGFIAGLAEILGTSYLAAQSIFGFSLIGVLEYQSFVPLAFIVITLLIAPNGLMGVNWRAVSRHLVSQIETLVSYAKSFPRRLR